MKATFTLPRFQWLQGFNRHPGRIHIGGGINAFILQGQSRGQFIQITHSGQGRQFIQAAQVEVVEKLTRGSVHGRTARHVAVPHDAHPLALKQGFYNLTANRHAANIFNLAPRNRLSIGNQGKRFQQGTGVALWPLFPEATYPGGVSFAHLQPPATGHLT